MLNNELYCIAFSRAITLSDICDNAEYTKDSHQTTDEEMSYISGSIIHRLRCFLLHERNPNIDNECRTKNNESLPIDHFVLKAERKNDFDIYFYADVISDMFR